jgi:hypothetical protein
VKAKSESRKRIAWGFLKSKRELNPTTRYTRRPKWFFRFHFGHYVADCLSLVKRGLDGEEGGVDTRDLFVFVSILGALCC